MDGSSRAVRGYGDGGAAGARRLRLRELRTAKEEREMKLRRWALRPGAGVKKAHFGLAWPHWAERRRRAATLRATRRAVSETGRPLCRSIQFVSRAMQCLTMSFDTPLTANP